jgi:hypothetical protein
MASVFISHRKGDDREAEQLAVEVRNAGHQVWLDVWNINLGDSITGRINEGLEAADYVIVCYSSLGISSTWMGREWMATLARQLEGQGVKILPVLLTGGGPPAILADILYVDLVKDWSGGVARLLQTIK